MTGSAPARKPRPGGSPAPRAEVVISAGWLLAAVSVVAAVVSAWLLWPSPGSAPQARQYLNVSACLLTSPSGIAAGTPGAPVWDAMESASLATHVMVSYLPEAGQDDATPMLNTLIERKCGVIITAGVPAGQVTAAAASDPHQRFVLVTGAGPDPESVPSNAVVVSADSAAAPIAQVIHSLAAQA
jgi:hypothetical protein